MKNLITRSLSGIIYVAIIVGAVIAGGWWFYMLTLILTLLGIKEYSHLIRWRQSASAHELSDALDYLGGVLVWGIVPMSYLFHETKSVDTLWITGMMTATFVFYILLRFICATISDDEDAMPQLGRSLTALLYIPLPLSLLNIMMYFMPDASEMILLMFIMIWLNDTGAYCVGSTIGRHKLCERLSPKKSWEGFYGGMILCIAAGITYACMYDQSVIILALYGLSVAIVSTIGDLFESRLKREAKVKDSGNLIPGHGGILDRIDSMLFVSMISFVFFLISHI